MSAGQLAAAWARARAQARAAAREPVLDQPWAVASERELGLMLEAATVSLMECLLALTWGARLALVWGRLRGLALVARSERQKEVLMAFVLGWQLAPG